MKTYYSNTTNNIYKSNYSMSLLKKELMQNKFDKLQDRLEELESQIPSSRRNKVHIESPYLKQSKLNKRNSLEEYLHKVDHKSKPSKRSTEPKAKHSSEQRTSKLYKEKIRTAKPTSRPTEVNKEPKINIKPNEFSSLTSTKSPRHLIRVRVRASPRMVLDRMNSLASNMSPSHNITLSINNSGTPNTAAPLSAKMPLNSK